MNKAIPIAAVAVGIGTFTLYQLGVFASDQPAPAVPTALQATPDPDAFPRMMASSLTLEDAAADPAKLDQVLAQMEVSGTPPTASSVNEVRKALAEFIAHRFLRKDVDGYVSYMEAQGRLPASAEYLGNWGLPATFESQTGTPWPAKGSTKDAFRQAWESWDTSRDLRSRPVALSSVKGGAAVRFGELRDFDINPLPPSGELSAATWRGSTGGVIPSYFDGPAASIQHFVKHSGGAHYAMTAVVMKYKDGNSYPIAVMFVRSSKNPRWVLANVQLWAAPQGAFFGLPY